MKVSARRTERKKRNVQKVHEYFEHRATLQSIQKMNLSAFLEITFFFTLFHRSLGSLVIQAGGATLGNGGCRGF
jgi:hypothetical protein